MEPGIKSAQKELDKYGIKSVAFNTEEDGTVCHIIGHKQIYANINYDTSDNTNGGANNATFGVYKNVSGSGLERGFSWDDSSGLRSDDYNNNVFTSSGRYSEAFWKALNSDGANNTDCIIKTNTNTNGGNDNGSLGSFEKTIGSESAGVLNFDSQSNLWADVSVGTVGSNSSRNSEIFGNTLNSDGANDTDCVIKTNTNGGNNNGTLGILEGTGKHGTIGYFSDDFQSGLRTDVSMDSTGMSCVGSSEAFWNTLNSNGANNTDCMIKTNTNTNGDNDNDRYLGVLEGIDRNESIGVYTDNDSSRLRTDDFVGNVYFDSRKNSGTFQNTLNSDDANNTDFMIKTNTNTNGGNNNGYLGILEGTGRCKPIGVFSGSNQSGLRTDDFVGIVGSNCTGNSEIFGNTLNSDNTDCMRTLVVVDIRGTSTNRDWVTDIGTQLNPKWGSFRAGMETVLKSLYHGTGETYVLLYRCVHSIILQYTAVEITTPFQT